ncbi:glucosaminidase domain-containing protein [bacterium]|nr:glucosaminidase domain-containing protein [bacterium]
MTDNFFNKVFMVMGKIGASLCGLAVLCIVVEHHFKVNNKNLEETVEADSYTVNTQILPEANIDEIIAETGLVSQEQQPQSYSPDEEKVRRVRTMLTNRKSPLADYAEEFVRAADYYGIDYRLVASISIIESSGGLHCFRQYNAWGWGKLNFESWTDGIWTVSKGLNRYYELGLVTPALISVSYCPPTHESWAAKVQSMMDYVASL